MNFIWDVEPLTNWISQLAIIVILYGAICLGFYFSFKRKLPIILTSVSLVCAVVSFLFNLNYAFISINIFFFVVATITSFFNLGVLRQFLANPFKSVKENTIKDKKGAATVIDKDKLYKQIEAAVLSCSQQKVGAIITFEKKVSLADVMKNGVMVNAPVSAELLQTIFYPGTRLHDGAVIIRDDQIVAASVFYTPTTKIISGKYGSRHRAALGISEVSDSVTVIVSEETGRISIANNGELSFVPPSKFLVTLQNYIESVKEDF